MTWWSYVWVNFFLNAVAVTKLSTHILRCLIWKTTKTKRAILIIISICRMSLVLSVLSEWLFFGVLNFALSFTLCTWRAVFSLTLLCAGLLQCVAIVSASHSSRFNLVFQFHSLMVNIRYCAISVPSVCIWCTVMHYCAVMHWRSVDRLLFYVKWVCVCACGYRMDLVGHGTHPASPLEIALEGEACTE